MINYIQVQNIALIDKIELYMENGLTIMSGETGTGKSILIDAMNFVLGSRASKEFISTGADFALIEMLVTVDNEEVRKKMADFSIEPDENNQLLLTRQLIKNGNTVAKINHHVVTVGMLKDIGSLLVDIHGQHEHQSLLHKQKHRELIDIFCGQVLVEPMSKLRKLLDKKALLVTELNEMKQGSVLEMDLLTYQLEEIELAMLYPNEEEELEEKRQKLLHAEKIQSSIVQTRQFLFGDEKVRDLLRMSINHIKGLIDLDKEMAEVHDFLMDMEANLDEISWKIEAFMGQLPSEDEDIDKIEKRLHDIFLLKRKYGQTIEDILSYGEEIKEKVDNFSNRESRIQKLEQELDIVNKESLEIANSISAERKKAAAMVENSILAELADLGMANAQFIVSIKTKETVDRTGHDDVEFLISTNKGETVKPLIQVASGGEMSRIMLALKMVLSDYDSIETFIFDEIDAGISGQAAQKVAEKLVRLSRNRQVMCITHLPQIAAMGDHHYLIEKMEEKDRTKTRISLLNEESSVNEIARLTSGKEVTKTSFSAAKELKEFANAYKKEV